MTSSLVGLGAPQLDGNRLYWLETRADQGGRTSLWRRDSSGERVELTPDHYVRTRVHEYGGGEYAVDRGVVVFSDFHDGRLYVARDGTSISPLTAEDGDVRFADLRVHADRDLVLAVREDHRGPDEAVNTVVAIDLKTAGQGVGNVLCSGADFYSTPELSSDGRLAWVEWDHPSMPWDATRVCAGDFDGSSVESVRTVAGAPTESAVQPRWAGDQLVFVSDRSGWWNLYLDDDGGAHALHPAAASFAEPQWTHGMTPYAVVDPGRLLCAYRDDGRLRLGMLDIASGQLDELGLAGEAWSLSTRDGRAALSLHHRDRAPELVVLDLDSEQVEVVRVAGELPFGAEWVSKPQRVSWSSEDGEVHGWYYPPTHPETDPDQGTGRTELPPLMTISHGGPTSFSPAVFRLAVQFWTTRGVAVLDVNYGGSAGYGRDYRERLRGRWGLVDVRDCAAGAVAMGDQGLADPARLAIMGGSAGGYTTLQALTTTRTFAAGISLFGVGDLETLARDTHKFESRYLDGLIGQYPARRELYVERSPINHVDDLAAPILLLQGSDDRVVPPNQAETMADAARAKKLAVALVIYPGEGHGFRRAETIKASYEAQLSFLGQIFDFVPAGDIPLLPIENL
jgi:dipeptidyl aminopeptidase/acylaminoacyl peptidase